MTIWLYRRAFASAQATWLDQSQELHALVGSLDDVDTGLLGPRVGAAAATFLDTWRGETEVLRREAQQYADSLQAALVDVTSTDREAYEALSGLLPDGTEPLP